MLVKWLQQLQPLHPHSTCSKGSHSSHPTTKGPPSSKALANLNHISRIRSRAHFLNQVQSPHLAGSSHGYLNQSFQKGDGIILTRLDKSGLTLGVWESSTPTTNQEEKNWKTKPWMILQCGKNVGEGFSGNNTMSTIATLLLVKEPHSQSPSQLSVLNHGLLESDNKPSANFLKYI